MNVETILNTLSEHGKEVTTVSVFRYLSRLGIKPVGVRQRPQNYPDDAAARILAHLGIVNGGGNGDSGRIPDPKAAARSRSNGLPSMAELKRTARRARANGKVKR